MVCDMCALQWGFLHWIWWQKGSFFFVGAPSVHAFLDQTMPPLCINSACPKSTSVAPQRDLSNCPIPSDTFASLMHHVLAPHQCHHDLPLDEPESLWPPSCMHYPCIEYTMTNGMRLPCCRSIVSRLISSASTLSLVKDLA